MDKKAYLELIRSLPCACCGKSAPSSAHHPREGQGMAQKAEDWAAIPLCWECHQGDRGLHGDRSRLLLRKRTEMGMLGETVAQVLRVLERGPLGVRGVHPGSGVLGLRGTSAGGDCQGGAGGAGVEPVYLGEAWLRAAKHDWARFTLHHEHMTEGNPFDGQEACRYMLAVIPLPEE